MDDIEVVIPASAETGNPDQWEMAVLMLTQELVRRGLADEPSYGLGGHWSYGTNFENDTFSLVRYCWCDEPDCPWCSGCECSEEAFWYAIDGKPCSYQEWVQFFSDNTPDISSTPIDVWNAAAVEANKRRSSGQHEDLKCDYCKGEKFAEYGQVAGWGVPMFWHKPSGVRMKAYKWWGRDTEVYIPDGCTVSPFEVLHDCVESTDAATTKETTA